MHPAAGAAALLVLAVGGVMARPWGTPGWLLPVAAVGVALLTGLVTPSEAGDAVEPLRAPLLFVVLAVPMAAQLDRLGVFRALAAAVPPHRLGPGLWLAGAVVVAVVNLDAAVVLCTPIWVRAAHRAGRDPVAFAFQPAMLACLASSALVVSNLTNLVVAERRGLTSTDFVVHLGPATLAAVGVGYVAWARRFPHRAGEAGQADAHGAGEAGQADVQRGPTHDRAAGTATATELAPPHAAAVLGALLVAVVAAGVAGVPLWVVSGAALAATTARTRRAPWGDLPIGVCVTVVGLAILAVAAAGGTDPWPAHGGTALQVAAAAAAANLANNLPAVIVLEPLVDGRGVWPLLLGLDLGPALVVTGSLSGLLWLDVCGRLGLHLRPLDYSRVGLRVGAPALLAATAVLAITEQLW